VTQTTCMAPLTSMAPARGFSNTCARPVLATSRHTTTSSRDLSAAATATLPAALLPILLGGLAQWWFGHHDFNWIPFWTLAVARREWQQ